MKRILLAASASAFAISALVSSANAATYKVSFDFDNDLLVGFEYPEIDWPARDFTLYFEHDTTTGPLESFSGAPTDADGGLISLDVATLSVSLNEDGTYSVGYGGYDDANGEDLRISSGGSVSYFGPDGELYAGSGTWSEVAAVPLPASGLILLAGLSGLFGRRFFSS